LLKVKLKGI